MPPVGVLVRDRLAPLFSMNRVVIYALCSILAITATTLNAMRTYNNFYSVAIHLSRSNRSLLVLANFGIFLALGSGRILQKIFFGPLLPAEVERLYDRTWFFITESLLAFTIFRDDFDVQFGIMFGFLLFMKCFHWILADRIEWMDQRPYPGPPPLFHIRVLALFGLLGLIDVIMLLFTVESTIHYGIGATVLFANEYAILIASTSNAMAKYFLSVWDLRRASTRGGADAPPWEAKSTYIFYIELVTDFVKLTTYLTFFVVIMMFYGLPLNIIRDVYITGHSFITRLTAFYRYRTATRDMDRRYPDATAAELGGEADKTCIICREEMVVRTPEEIQAQPPRTDGPNMTPKKLPCGHIFHFHCLKSWLERQQNCPTCRRTVLETGAAAAPTQANGVAQPAGNAGLPPPPFPNGPRAQARANNNQGRFAQAIDRFFGVAGQPPLVPGQFGNGPLPVRPNVGNHGGAAPGAGGPGQPRAPALVFEYNYVWDPAARAQVPMPPPFLQGFYREDGLWQGWPAGAQAAEPGQPTATSNTNGSLAPPANNPAGFNATATDVAPTIPAAGATNEATPSSSASKPISPTSANDTNSTGLQATAPRDAAAAAALRRFGGSAPLRPSPLSRSSSSADITTPSGSSSPLSNTTTANPTVTASTSSTQPTSSMGATSASSTVLTPTPTKTIPASATRIPLPSVIPMYDYARSQSAATRLLQPPLASQFTPHFANNPASFPSSAAGPSLSELPDRLTEEQLTRLDALTREAIDERLRILENVGGAINRCTEELLRARSVLPDVASQTRAAPFQPQMPARPTGSRIPTAQRIPSPEVVAQIERDDEDSLLSQSKGKDVDPSERRAVPLRPGQTFEQAQLEAEARWPRYSAPVVPSHPIPADLVAPTSAASEAVAGAQAAELVAPSRAVPPNAPPHSEPSNEDAILPDHNGHVDHGAVPRSEQLQNAGEGGDNESDETSDSES